MALIEELGLPRPDLIDTDVGHAIALRRELDAGPQLAQGDRLRLETGRNPQSFGRTSRVCSPRKRSTSRNSRSATRWIRASRPVSRAIKKILREAGLRAKVVMSLGMYLDIIPVRGGSDLSMRHLLWKWGFAPEHVLVAGDSGNDAGMLLGRTLGVVVGNHSPELNRLRNRPRIYFAEASHAAGILEGISYYNFLDKIVIPNDRIE